MTSFNDPERFIPDQDPYWEEDTLPDLTEADLNRLEAEEANAPASAPECESPPVPDVEPPLPTQLDFQMSPHLLRTLCEHQATTLARAVTEAVTNSADAGATEVRVHWQGGKRLTITDDGRGLHTREEIDKYFRMLGFDHAAPGEQGRRQYGEYGLGRLQLMAFGVTTWRTGEFELRVDLHADGMCFTLREGLPFHPGLRITVDLYERDYRLSMDLPRAVRFMTLPVLLRHEDHPAQQLNVPPHTRTWDHEDDDAYYHLAASDRLSIFNMGVHVGEFGTDIAGSGGLVVTKKPLKLNISRTTQIHHDALFDRVKKTLRRLARARLREMAKLSDVDIGHAVQLALEGDLPWEDLRELRLIRDVSGKTYTVERYAAELARRPRVGLTPHIGDREHDVFHQQGLALVLHPSTLGLLGVQELEEIPQRLHQLAELSRDSALLAALARAHYARDLPDVIEPQDEHWRLIEPERVKKAEAALLTALSAIQPDLEKAAGVQGRARRTLRVGEAATALAWTDGESYVAFDRAFLREYRRGPGGFAWLAHVFLHELIHRERSSGSHVHDPDFYARYHEASMHRAFQGAAQRLQEKFVALALHAELGLTVAVLAGSAVTGRSLDDLWRWHRHAHNRHQDVLPPLVVRHVTRGRGHYLVEQRERPNRRRDDELILTAVEPETGKRLGDPIPDYRFSLPYHGWLTSGRTFPETLRSHVYRLPKELMGERYERLRREGHPHEEAVMGLTLTGGHDGMNQRCLSFGDGSDAWIDKEKWLEPFGAPAPID